MIGFADIFAEPKSLHSHRCQDHKIVLKEGTSPVNFKPYSYSAVQKHLIEKTVQEMLEVRVIRPSKSPYSSPIFLAKKNNKDGTWRLCRDYKQLPKGTILNEFSIRIIEELLDNCISHPIFLKLI